MINIQKQYQFDKSLRLQKRFHKLIPGGAHTYAKGDDQFPEFMPPYIVKGKGCRVWDIDGNEYIEYSNGIRSVILGHAFEPIIQAAYKQMQNGINFVRPSTIELEYAEEFLDVLEGAEMIKFGKNGSDAVNGAIRLSRAFTGRDKIGICADHPFFSVDDWFIATTPMSAGIPETTKKITTKFNYNNIDSVEKMFADNPNQIACVILEPEKYTPPKDNFLHKLKDICHKNGAIFILDEMITGFRAHIGGAQKKYNIIPDLSTFGKAMANGFSISALVGKKELMELGGLKHKKEKVFLLSLTHGGETHAIAAARATLDFYKKNPVIEKLTMQGNKLKEGLSKAAEELQIANYFQIIGPEYCSVYTTLDVDKNHSEEFRTLFLQETIKRGLLMPSTIVSYSHEDKDIEETVDKVYDALIVYKKALNEGIDKYLIGKSIKPVFRRYN
jgi:glutamate-1-semialdehyde 2,1-aminomutase